VRGLLVTHTDIQQKRQTPLSGRRVHGGARRLSIFGGPCVRFFVILRCCCPMALRVQSQRAAEPVFGAARRSRRAAARLLRSPRASGSDDGARTAAPTVSSAPLTSRRRLFSAPPPGGAGKDVKGAGASFISPGWLTALQRNWGDASAAVRARAAPRAGGTGNGLSPSVASPRARRACLARTPSRTTWLTC